jgi:hypothetical protein
MLECAKESFRPASSSQIPDPSQRYMYYDQQQQQREGDACAARQRER